MFKVNIQRATDELARGFSDTATESFMPLWVVLLLMVLAVSGVVYAVGKYYQNAHNLPTWSKGFAVFSNKLELAQEKKEPFWQEYLLTPEEAWQLGKHIDCFLKVTLYALFVPDYCMHIVYHYATINPKFRSLSDKELLRYIIQCVVDFYQTYRGVIGVPVYVKEYKYKVLYLIIPLNKYGYRILKPALDAQERFLNEKD